MNKTTLICGSLAFDKIMQYHGRFAEALLADQLHKVNVSFLVPTLRTEYGGCSANIAYNLKMLGGDPLIMATIGQDGGEYLERFEQLGIATRGIRKIGHAYTAQCFVTADLDNNQINAFHPGAMQFSHENNVADCGALRVAIIAPDGRDGMLKHATDCATLKLPFMFDPGQQLPMFSGAELIDFIDKASYVAANDYEFEMLMDRTGLTLADIAVAPGGADRHARRERLGNLRRRRALRDPVREGGGRGGPDRLRRRLPRRPAVRDRQRLRLGNHRPPGQPDGRDQDRAPGRPEPRLHRREDRRPLRRGVRLPVLIGAMA